MVMVRQGADRKIVHVREPNGYVVLVRPGGDRRVKKIVPKWSRGCPSVIVLKSEGKVTLHQKRVRQRRKSLILAPHFAHFLKLFRRLLCHHLHFYISSPAPTCYTWLQRISTCILPDILPREAYSAHAYS